MAGRLERFCLGEWRIVSTTLPFNPCNTDLLLAALVNGACSFIAGPSTVGQLLSNIQHSGAPAHARRKTGRVPEEEVTGRRARAGIDQEWGDKIQDQGDLARVWSRLSLARSSFASAWERSPEKTGLSPGAGKRQLPRCREAVTNFLFRFRVFLSRRPACRKQLDSLNQSRWVCSAWIASPGSLARPSHCPAFAATLPTCGRKAVLSSPLPSATSVATAICVATALPRATCAPRICPLSLSLFLPLAPRICRVSAVPHTAAVGPTAMQHVLVIPLTPATPGWPESKPSRALEPKPLDP